MSKTMTNKTTAGSWFPSGFHGHFRSKSRSDFLCEYRNLAKPQPPIKFFNKANQPWQKHIFSHHDNRNSFMSDALYFEQGLGRKRVPNSTYKFKPDFVAWVPKSTVENRDRMLISSYRQNFSMSNYDNSNRIIIVPQIIINRPATSFDDVPTSSYRYSHGSANPNKQIINAMNNESLRLTTRQRQQRAQTAKASLCPEQPIENVASCLIWHPFVPKPPGKPKVPAATQTTDFSARSDNSENLIQTPVIYNSGLHDVRNVDFTKNATNIGDVPSASPVKAVRPDTAATLSWPLPAQLQSE